MLFSGVFWETVSWNYVILMRWHLGCLSQWGAFGGSEWWGHKEESQREVVDMTDEGRWSDCKGKIKGDTFFQTYLMMRCSKQTTWSSKNILKSLTLIGGKIIYGVRYDKTARIHRWKLRKILNTWVSLRMFKHGIKISTTCITMTMINQDGLLLAYDTRARS